MKRATGILFALAAAAALLLAFSPTAQAQQAGILERIEAKLDQLLARGTSATPAQPADPSPSTPTTPTIPAGGSDITLNGAGTAYFVRLPATIRITNAIPGSWISVEKMPPIVRGLFCLRENGQPIGEVPGDCAGPRYNIGIGDRTLTLTSELPGMVVTVQLRPGG